MEVTTDIFKQFDKKWALLTAGSMEKFNTMTISWGGLGTLWSKPVASVYVRTSRYTHEFMDEAEKDLAFLHGGFNRLSVAALVHFQDFLHGVLSFDFAGAVFDIILITGNCIGVLHVPKFKLDFDSGLLSRFQLISCYAV